MPNENIDNDFLYYALSGTMTEMRSLTYGTVFDTITKQTFDNWVIPLPPLPEQRAIANVLGTLDDKIELSRRMNETLESMARALFKSWFVDFDPVRAKMGRRWRPGESLPGLPGPPTTTYSPTASWTRNLGPIPEGWEVKRALGEHRGCSGRNYAEHKGHGILGREASHLDMGDFAKDLS